MVRRASSFAGGLVHQAVPVSLVFLPHCSANFPTAGEVSSSMHGIYCGRRPSNPFYWLIDRQVMRFTDNGVGRSSNLLIDIVVYLLEGMRVLRMSRLFRQRSWIGWRLSGWERRSVSNRPMSAYDCTESYFRVPISAV